MVGLALLLLAQPLGSAAYQAALTRAEAAPRSAPVAYDLRVRFDPSTHRITGEGEVQFENSTDRPTDELWWHLYLNAFKNDHSTFLRKSQGLRGDRREEGEWGFIELTTLTAVRPKGDPAPAELLTGARYAHPDDDNTEDRTVLVTPLPFALGPGEKLTLHLTFTAQLPKVFARSGFSGTFTLAGQWFPKLGVLTEAGWNCHQYHALSEFFADYGAYRVAITVPPGHRVGATGSLLEQQTEADGWETTVWAEGQVHDFAFAVDPRFKEARRTFSAAEAAADPDTLEVARALGLEPAALALKDVEIRLLYAPEHEAYAERYLEAMVRGLGWFGRRYGAYPYPTLTVIDGPRGAGGAMGMEYPTLITGGVRWPGPISGPEPEQVALHELAHQWWYGLVGSNEFEEAWLDEGFTTYSSGLAMDALYGPKIFGPWWLHPWLEGRRLDQQSLWRLGTLLAPERDAIVRPAWDYRDDNSYGMNVYPRAALTLAALGRQLGPDVLLRALRLYQARFRHRHPTTAHFQAVVEEVSGQSQERFFQDLVRDSAAVDYGITELRSEPLRAAQGFGDPNPGELPSRLQASTSTPAGFRTVVVVERRRAIVRPVVVELVFEDGRRERWSWDGVYRWGRYEAITAAQLKEAHLDPDGIELLDLGRIDNHRQRERDHRPGLVLGGWMFAVVQSAWQILGAFW